MTQEEIDIELQKLKDDGVHHASKEFKERKAELEALLSTEPSKTTDKKPTGMEIVPSESYTFTLNRKEHLRIIPREATVWDEGTNKIRKIRFVKTEDSPFVDEQDPDAVVDKSPIIFKGGKKVVSGRDAALIRYLLAYDGNGAKRRVSPQNTGIKNLYSLFDPTAKAREARKMEERRNKARNIVERTDFETLRAYTRSTYGILHKTEDDVKDFLYTQISTLPRVGKAHAADLIIDDIENPKHMLKATIQEAVSKGILSIKGDKISHGQTGALIIRYDSKADRFDEVLANYILQGGEDAENIKKLINK